jgi:hypothetical protein
MNESKSVKIEISNNTKKPLLLSLEPWGEDYTLLEQEEVEIIADDCGENFHYQVVFHENFVAVWADGGNEYPKVYKNGEELDCGYNREFSPIKL